jgi:hypothetical protein
VNKDDIATQLENIKLILRRGDMFKIFKYLFVLLKLKDVSKTYKEEGLNVKSKPFWVSRRFIGAVLIAVAAIVKVVFNIEIDPTNIETMTGAILGIGVAAETLYGAIMIVVGQKKKTIKLGVKLDAKKKAGYGTHK